MKHLRVFASALALAPVLTLAAALPLPASAQGLGDADRTALLGNVAKFQPEMDKAALDIWKLAEVGYMETKSSAILQAQLKAAGFTIETGVAGMPTAFIARFRQGTGPVIGVLAEYDALPGMAQAAVPQREAIAGLKAGHACGHNLFGAASVAAAVAVKEWMVANKVGGELRVYGSPAEEGGSGKVFLVRAGLTKDVDSMLHWHAADRNSAAQGGALANSSGKFRFTGVAAHAAAAPDRGRSALDAVEAMNVMVNMMREHVPQDTRIHYVITDGGKAPNVVPEAAEVYYYVRHPNQSTVKSIMARVKQAADGAALGTGTKVSFQQIGGTFDLLPNDTLGRVMYENLKRVGGISWTAEEKAFAAALTPTLPEAKEPPPGVDTILPYEQTKEGMGSTDVGDVSYTTPTAGMVAAAWVPGTPAHSWQAVAANGTTIGLKGAAVAAKTLALTAAELFRSPETVTAAKAELEKRRGPNFVYQPLLGDIPPALDYRKSVMGGE